MDRMFAPPDIIWRQRQYPDNTPDPIIEDPAAEKSSMPAVVLDQEKTDQERARRHAYGKGQPVADRKRPPGSAQNTSNNTPVIINSITLRM